MVISSKWRAMAEMYKRFGEGDFSQQAAQDMFLYESRGGTNPGYGNGYYAGKHLMDVTIKMWKEDLKGSVEIEGILCPILFRWELEAEYPMWFLNRVLGKER